MKTAYNDLHEALTKLTPQNEIPFSLQELESIIGLLTANVNKEMGKNKEKNDKNKGEVGRGKPFEKNENIFNAKVAFPA